MSPTSAHETDKVEVNHSSHSMLRELIVEYLFIGELLRECWRVGVTDVEVLRSDTDSFGYDLVLSRGPISRHVQLKTSRYDAKTDKQKISLSLASKPSGCVIWILITDKLEFRSFLWFGGPPGKPLPEIIDKPIAKHTKGTSEGAKNDRLNHREIKRKEFETEDSLKGILDRLFGDLSA